MQKSFKYDLLLLFICLIMVTITGTANHKECKPYRKHSGFETIKENLNIDCHDVWVISNIDIKSKPNANSKTIGKFHCNDKISVLYLNDDWAKVKGKDYYLDRKLITDTPIKCTVYQASDNDIFKSYMDYRTITSTTSNQYKMQINHAYTNDDGLRMVNGRYCIALGSYYTTSIGQYVDVKLENGNVIHGILGDCKSNEHTDSRNQNHIIDGSIVEFIVDTDYLDENVIATGNVSNINNWNSKVVNIKVYDYIEQIGG